MERMAPTGHLPVMYPQVLQGLQVNGNGTYLDGTFGRGGHARGILARLGADGRLLLMDKDPEAIAAAEQEFAADPRVSIRRGSFAGLASWDAASAGLDGVLFDLGVSSPQLDVAERGFSFGRDGPMDMRMDPDSGQSAAQWLAMASEQEIAQVLWTYGEERMGRRIARTIVARREEQPLLRTAQLADLIASVMPRSRDGKHHIHPATRSFQAIRIFINRELADLEAGLDAALSCLKPGGRLAVISFHSLEDRIVKQFIARHARPPAANRRFPDAQEFVARLRPVDAAQKAPADELAVNPRARSAVLRVAEMLPGSRDSGLGTREKPICRKRVRRAERGFLASASFAPAFVLDVPESQVPSPKSRRSSPDSSTPSPLPRVRALRLARVQA